MHSPRPRLFDLVEHPPASTWGVGEHVRHILDGRARDRTVETVGAIHETRGEQVRQVYDEELLEHAGAGDRAIATADARPTENGIIQAPFGSSRMSKDDGSSFSTWLLLRMYGGLTAVVLVLTVVSLAFPEVINRSTVTAIAGLWALVTVYGLVSRVRG